MRVCLNNGLHFLEEIHSEEQDELTKFDLSGFWNYSVATISTFYLFQRNYEILKTSLRTLCGPNLRPIAIDMADRDEKQKT